MPGRRLVQLLALFLALGLVAAACSSKKAPSSSGGSPTEESSGGTITVGSDRANNKGTKDVTGKSSIEVELDNFYFEPTVLKGSPGAQIKLELKNEASGTLHNFSLPDQSVNQDVPSEQSVDMTVTFPQSGFLEFFCKYHKASGMVGELSV
jgi:plastocyanin